MQTIKRNFVADSVWLFKVQLQLHSFCCEVETFPLKVNKFLFVKGKHVYLEHRPLNLVNNYCSVCDVGGIDNY